jgi:large subunit ribosomal protein L24
MKLRKDDKVIVLTWKDKKKEGKILKVLNKENKVLVEWINVVSRHIKKMWTNPGQILKMEKPIDVSNVMLICPHTSKPTRIWYVTIDEKNWVAKKFRYSKKAVKELNKESKDVIIK